MLRNCIVVAGLILTPVVSQAAEPTQKIWKFDTEVLDNSLKCDIAMAARSGRYIIPEGLNKAWFSINLDKSKNVENKISFKFPFFSTGASAGNTSENKTKNDYTAVINISGKNYINCTKNNRFATGNLDCLRGAVRRLADRDVSDQYLHCEATFTATYTGSASAKLPAWKIELGPELSGKNSVSYKISIVMPASKAPKDGK